MSAITSDTVTTDVRVLARSVTKIGPGTPVFCARLSADGTKGPEYFIIAPGAAPIPMWQTDGTLDVTKFARKVTLVGVTKSAFRRNRATHRVTFSVGKFALTAEMVGRMPSAVCEIVPGIPMCVYYDPDAEDVPCVRLEYMTPVSANDATVAALADLYREMTAAGRRISFVDEDEGDDGDGIAEVLHALRALSNTLIRAEYVSGGLSRALEQELRNNTALADTAVSLFADSDIMLAHIRDCMVARDQFQVVKVVDVKDDGTVFFIETAGPSL